MTDIEYPDFSLMEKNSLFLLKRKNKMTKSQNTKNEQLTEQWKKGELPSGEYYIKTKRNEEVITEGYFDGFQSFDWHDNKDIEQVLAPVPTFEEWQASEKYNKHLEEKIKIYERKDKQATETSVAYNKLAEENEELKEILERHKKATAKAQIRSCDLEIINAQLKELLKECREEIGDEIDDCTDPRIELFAKISEALK